MNCPYVSLKRHATATIHVCTVKPLSTRPYQNQTKFRVEGVSQDTYLEMGRSGITGHVHYIKGVWFRGG